MRCVAYVGMCICVSKLFGICREYARNRYGPCMEVWCRYGAARYCNYLLKAAALLTEQSATYARNIDGICLEYVWDTHGICMEYERNMYGIHMEHAWDACGIFAEHQWNMHAICMDYAWNTDRICMEYA